MSIENPQVSVQRQTGAPSTSQRPNKWLWYSISGSVVGLLLVVAAIWSVPTTTVVWAQAAATPTQAITSTASLSETMTVTAIAGMTSTYELTPTTGMTATGALTTTNDATGTVLIQVAGRTITQAEYKQMFLRMLQNLADRRGIPLNEGTITIFRGLRNQFLQQLAAQQVLLAEADKRNIQVDDQQLQNLLRLLQRNFRNPQAFQQALQADGFANEQALRQYIRQQLRIRRVLAQMRQNIQVTDAQIRAYYQAHLADFTNQRGQLPLAGARLEIRSILVDQQVQAQIQQLRQQYGVHVYPSNLPALGQLLQPAMQTNGALAPFVTVYDQALQALQQPGQAAVVVARVWSNGPGWIVIHADNNGAPGAVLGHSPVHDGANNEVVVEVTRDAVTPTLYAMLHTDAGQVGTYEFPGADKPVMDNGQLVSPAFAILETTTMSGTGTLTGTNVLTNTGAMTGTATLTGTNP